MRLLRLLALTLLLALAVPGQTDRGTITGAIQDPAGAVVPGAVVIARHIANGSVSQTTATATGNFTLPALSAGLYEVSAEVPGFKKFIESGARVEVSQVTRIDIVLQVGAATDSVTVEASAPLLKSDSAEQSMNLTGDRINALPLDFGSTNGAVGGIRTVLSFMTLSPGVGGDDTNARVNGQLGGTYRIFVDGQDVSNNNSPTSTAGQPSVENVEEFSLQTSNFAAEYGQVAGGMFTFAMRSGTNKFHGSLYEYFTNEKLDASVPFGTFDAKGNALPHAKPKSRKNDYGGLIAGPVWIPKIYDGHNKTFFAFNYEGFRNVTSLAGSVKSVPTEAFRNGDFSTILGAGRTLMLSSGNTPYLDPLGRQVNENQIFDPLSIQFVNGTPVRNAFPGNKIPTSRLDPIALKIQALFPLPDNGSQINNWSPIAIVPKKQSFTSIKLDHNFAPTSKISFFESHQLGLQHNGPDGLPIPISTFRIQDYHSETERLNWDHSITPRMLLHLGVGDTLYLNPDIAPSSITDYDTAGKLGLKGSYSGKGFPIIGGLSSSTYGGMIGVGPTVQDKLWYGKFTAIASLTYIRNRHSYKIGGEYRNEMFSDNNTVNTQGNLQFSSTETSQPSLQNIPITGGLTTGFNYASFLLGQVNNGSIKPPQDPQWRNQRWGLYFQDNWKVTPRLTLDIGLRWDLLYQGHEIHNRSSMFGPGVINPNAGGLKGGVLYEGYGTGRCNCEFTDRYPYAIGPRLGLAYQIDKKTVFRAGWGVVYGNLRTYNNFTGSPIQGVGFDTKFFTTTNPGVQPAFELKDGFVYDRAALTVPSLNPGLINILSAPAYMIDRNGSRPPRIQQWSVGVQREVMRNMVAEAAYVGSRTIWIVPSGTGNITSLNVPDPALLKSQYGIDIANPADRTLLTSRIDSALAAQRGFKAPYVGYPGSASVAQTLRPFPQFTGFGPSWAPLANGWYDSLQAKLTKRYSHGLDMTGAFTWSKELGTGMTTANDIFNRPNQKSLADTSQPLILVMAINYEVPKVTSNKLVRAIVGGWVTGGILRYASGMPIPVPASTSLASYVFQNTRFNRVPGVPLYLKDLNCHCYDPNKELVLNPAAWTDALPGQFGVSAPYYNDYRYKRKPSENLIIGRMFHIREKTFLQIRGEMFNALNRTRLPNPDGSNPLATPVFSNLGVPTAGFGRINASASTAGERTMQLVGRFQF